MVSVRCDVTDPQSVQQAIGTILARSARIDGLVNCAGYGIAGAIEDTTDQEMHDLLECNYFGALRMINAVLPVMRNQLSGTIVNISSVGGVFGLPFQAFYSAGKFALEGTSQALRNEVRPFGIKVCSVQPGDIKTGFTSMRRYTAATAKSTAYKLGFCSAINAMSRDELRGAPPDTAAKTVVRALKAKNPPPKMVVGFTYKLLCLLNRLLPARLVDWALYKLYCTGATQSKYWSFSRDVLKQQAPADSQNSTTGS